jgi:hypothetical protein
VRRFVQRRDDPLVDDALCALSDVTNMTGEMGMERRQLTFAAGLAGPNRKKD